MRDLLDIVGVCNEYSFPETLGWIVSTGCKPTLNYIFFHIKWICLQNDQRAII